MVVAKYVLEKLMRELCWDLAGSLYLKCCTLSSKEVMRSSIFVVTDRQFFSRLAGSVES